MKTFVAVLALAAVAVADSESFYPGYPGMVSPYGMWNHHQAAALPYGAPGHHMLPFAASPFQRFGGFGTPLAFNQVNTPRVIAKRESDSDSFYPGYPFGAPSMMPYHPYGHMNSALPYAGHHMMQMPYHHQAAIRPYAAHPFAYNPLLRIVQQEEKKVEEPVRVMEKRESDSESFYPGYPFTTPYGFQHHAAATPYGIQHPHFGMNPHFYNRAAAMPMVNQQVLPYAFPFTYRGLPTTTELKVEEVKSL